MRPLIIKVTNFRAFEGIHELNLNNISEAVVIGQNGAGKSSLIIDSMLYALFGKARKRPENLINKLSNIMSIELTFSHSNETYKIIREQKEAKQSLKLYRGDKDISERLLTATQKKLEQIIGITYDLLLSTAVAQQEEINKLSTMLPSEREKILNEMLGYSKWEQKKEKINKILSEYKDLDKTVQVKQEEISVNQQKINTIQNDLLTNKQKREFFEELKIKYQKKLDELEKHRATYQKFLKVESEYKNTHWTYEQLQKSLLELPTLNTTQVTDNIKKLEDGITENKETIEEINVEISRHKTEISDIDKRLQDINTYIKLEPQTKILDDVPCVGLDIHDQCKLLSNALDSKKAINKYLLSNNIENLNSAQVSLTVDKNKLQDKIVFFDDSRNKLTKDTLGLQSKISELNQQLRQVSKKEEITKEIENKKTILVNLAKEMNSKPQFDQAEYTSVNDNLNKSSQEYQRYEIFSAKQETELTYLHQSNQKTDIELTKYVEIQAKLANYRVLQQAYNDIPTLLFEQAIPAIEEYTNEILTKIFPSEQIQLRSFKETKSNTLQKALDVVSLDGTDFEDKSGSEKARQSLALRIALARYNSEQNSVQMPFFLVDEGGFGSLDDDNVVILKIMLKEIAKRFELFLIVTHLQDLKDTFSTQIVVNSNGKGAKVEVYSDIV